MSRAQFVDRLERVFEARLAIAGNFAIADEASADSNQQQTNDVFSEKWDRCERSDEKERLYEFQREWYLKLYGFASEDALREYLAGCDVVIDAGCGLGYKAAWFARLAPHALVIGMDYSDAALLAAQNYATIANLFFVRGDIARTGLRDGSVDYASCDQTIMHTESPERTFSELARITRRAGAQVACYFYAKKALPRELLDDYFRKVIKRCEASWRKVVATAAMNGIPIPAISTALAFYDGYRSERLPANLLQAQRDYFGAHTYERVDAPRGKFFHTNWTGTGGNVSASTYTV